MRKWLLIFILVSCGTAQAQLQNYLQALKPDSAEILYGRPTSSTPFWTIFTNLATATDSIMSAVVRQGYNSGNYADLATAASAAASDTASLIVSQRHAITTNTTISGKTSVFAQRGARFNISSGVTLTFADTTDFWAGDYQVFEGAGNVRGLKTAKPQWWGAVGDGVTIDSSAFRKGLQSLTRSGTGRGTLLIPGGTYIMSNARTDVKSNILIQGKGIGVTRLKQTARGTGNRGVFRVDGDSLITFRDLEIFGNPQDNQGYGEFESAIVIDDAEKVVVQNCYLHNMAGDGIELEGTSTDIIITNNIINIPLVAPVSDTLVGRNGITISSGSNIQIVGNKILEGYPAGIDIEPTPANASDSVYNISIIGNTILNAFYGISPNASGAFDDVHDIQIVGNTIADSDSIGIWGSGGSRLIISNNNIRNNDGDGIKLTRNTHAQISGNVINNNSRSGITIASVSDFFNVSDNTIYSNGIYGITVDASTYGAISNNVIFNNSNADSGSFHGINLGTGSDKNIITGNRTFDNQTPKSQYYGILISSSDSNFVTANYCYEDSSHRAGVAEIFETGSTGNQILWNYIGNNYKLAVNKTDQLVITHSGLIFGTNGASATDDSLVIHSRSGGVATGLIINNPAAIVAGRGSRVQFDNNGTTIAEIRGTGDGAATDGKILFHTTSSGTNSEKMRLDKNGNLTIGLTSSTAKLAIADNDTLEIGGFQTADYAAPRDAFWFDPGGDTLFVKNNGVVRYVLTTAYSGSGH